MGCLNCGKNLGRGQRLYCSNKCQQYYQYTSFIQRWKIGMEDGMLGEYQISKHIKRYLLEKFNNACSKCGWHEKNPYTELIPLEVEHIDGNYKNNSESNLDILCPNCHSLTATYKGANAGKGRLSRKKYSL